MNNFILYLVFSFAFYCSCNQKQPSFAPISATQPFVLVSDEAAAKKIALEVWVPMYGEQILADTPFVCSLKDSIWVVEGTLPKNMKGGVPYIHIGKWGGKVFLVGHGK